MIFDKTNCETDQDVFVTTQQSKPYEHLLEQSKADKATSSVTDCSVTYDVALSATDEDPSSSFIEPPDTDDSLNLETSVTASLDLSNHSVSEEAVTLEICSVVYFAGWLGKSCVDKFDCSDCKTILLKDKVDLTDKRQLLLINSTYTNIVTPSLKSPSDFLYQLVNKLLDFYIKNIDTLFKNNLVADLTDRFKEEINFTGNYHDLIHFDYLIKKLLEVKIHDYCKSQKKSMQSASKVRILQNK